MRVNRDFRDLFAALNDAGADYLVVGAHALAAHGQRGGSRISPTWSASGARRNSALVG